MRFDTKECALKVYSRGAPHSFPKAWTLRGTAFIDYVALEVKVSIFAGGAQDLVAQSSVVTFEHTSARDVVRFSELVERALRFVMRQGRPWARPRG